MTSMGLRFSDESLPVAYDRLFTASLFEPWARVLLDLVGVGPGDAVLDVGTGPGTVARLAAARSGASGRVVGIDLSAPMLEVARSKSTEPGSAPVEFTHTAADDLQLADGSFDVVLCQQSLQFFPDQIAALREMRRVMRTGARVGLGVWAKGYARDIEPILGECLSQLGAEAPTYPLFGTRPSDLPDALSQVGFQTITCEERTIQLTYAGGVDEVIQTWGASPMRAELIALDPSRAQQFRDCAARRLQTFRQGTKVVTSSVASLAIATKSS